MPKEYDYSFKYVEKDKNVKFRKCKNCNITKSVAEMEVRSICSICYIKTNKKKRCYQCKLRRPIKYFVKGVKTKLSTKDGYLNQCKFCIKDYQEENKEKIKKKSKEYRKKNAHKFRKYAAERRALKIAATLSPCYNDEIDLFYKKCPKGFEVDHIIPLNHPDFCGLHVPWNLQYLTRSENRKKKNKLILAT